MKIPNTMNRIPPQIHHNIFIMLLYQIPIYYCVQLSTFMEHIQDSMYEKAKRMNSSLDNVAKSL